MEKYITLLGAEQVQSAARQMTHAADTMLRAASAIDEAISRQQRFMDDWLMRFEAAITQSRQE